MEITYSFIIPHKNCPKLLERCMNSIPQREDIQIIVVDDNSDADKRPSIFNRKVEIIYLNADQSKGAGRARNVGLSHAVGEWLFFPDSDDYYIQGFLNVLDKYTDNKIDIIYFNSEYRDGETNELIDPMCFQREFDEYDGSKDSIDKIKYHHNAPWTKMINKNYVLKNGFQFEEVPNGNDILFSMSIGCGTDKIEVIKQPLYVYLRNKNSLTQKKATEAEAFCVILHTIQLNHFYKSIGHTEWSLPILKNILYYIKVSGLSFFSQILNRISLINKHCSDWTIDTLNNKLKQ